MAYGEFKDLARRTLSNKILHNKAFNIAKNPKYDEYQRRLALLANDFFDKKKILVVGLKMSRRISRRITQTNY